MSDLIVSIFFITGSVFILIAAIGLIRFNDLFLRIHAATKSSSFGLLFIIAATSIYFHSFDVYVKSILIIVFIYLTAPLAAHSIVKSFLDNNKE
jgi:multicomponent Na+:H+ antiporter subunit G